MSDLYDNVSEPVVLSGARAVYDFSVGLADQTGNGYDLSGSGEPPVGYQDGRVVRLHLGGTNDKLTASTAVIGDNDFPIIWALVWVPGGGPGSNVSWIAGRGQDGSGTGWSARLNITENGVVDARIVTKSSFVQWIATRADALVYGAWNFIALIAQTTASAEPSHVSAWCNGSVSRTGLTGISGLRDSTVGVILGGNQSGTATANDVVVAAVGIELVNSLTEAEALERVRWIEAAVMRGAPTPQWTPTSATTGGDVSVALSGQASTASAGTLAPSASIALSGQEATASAGVLAPVTTIAPSGEAVTASAGTITYQVAGDVTVALSGHAVTASAGTLVYEPYVERPASGVPGRWYTSIKGRAHFGSREEIEALLRQMAQDHAEEDERLEALGEKPLKRKVRVVQPGRAQVKETKAEQTVVTLPAAVAELSGMDSAQALAIYRVAYGLHKRREELREKRQKAAEKLEAQERAEIVAALNKAIGGMTSRPATMSDLAALERRIMRAIK